MKIIIFGTGNIYRISKKYIPNTDKVVGFLDNNQALWNTKIDGVKVINPKQYGTIDFDKIILMSDAAYYMQKQLLELGCKSDEIVHYKEYFLEKKDCKVDFYHFDKSERKKSILIISTPLGYHGGSLAAVYLGETLLQSGYNVLIAAEYADGCFIEEMSKKGLAFAIGEGIYQACRKSESWVYSFDRIIVNTFPMFFCLTEIASKRDVYFWLHESANIYLDYFFGVERLNTICKEEICKRIHIYAVSEIAKKNFEDNVRLTCEGILEYALPDARSKGTKGKKEIVFALIGSFDINKGQDLLFDAIELLNEEIIGRCSFWFIGKENETSYMEELRIRAKQMPSVRFLGEKSRSELMSLFSSIDVFVIPSREETMSMVATEAMMNGKTCIISDNTGIASYVKDGESAILFTNGNIIELKNKMEWCVNNYSSLKLIGKQARTVYEEHFSYGALTRKAEEILVK